MEKKNDEDAHAGKLSKQGRWSNKHAVGLIKCVSFCSGLVAMRFA